MRRLIHIACVLLTAYTAQAQEKIFLHPNEDPHWYYVVNETFDSTLDKGIWNSRAPWGPVDTVSTCDYTNYPNGVVTNNDIYAATTKGYKNFSKTAVLALYKPEENNTKERFGGMIHLELIQYGLITPQDCCFQTAYTSTDIMK